jgi:hypothetical protein
MGVTVCNRFQGWKFFGTVSQGSALLPSATLGWILSPFQGDGGKQKTGTTRYE